MLIADTTLPTRAPNFILGRSKKTKFYIPKRESANKDFKFVHPLKKNREFSGRVR